MNLYLQYDSELKNRLKNFSSKINSYEDIKANLEEYKKLEREITIKHSEAVSKISNKFNTKSKIIGFHGQTIIHKPQANYSIQMGNAELLCQNSSTDVVYNFRENDIKNGGDGAPLAPIYHHNIKKKFNLKKPVLFLNIGGIANYTFSKDNFFCAKDVGPGNCLMDKYIKKTKNLDFDRNGYIASKGKVDNSLLNNIFEHEFYNSKDKHSLDIKDFDINFVKGLSVEDAMANLNFFTAKFISNKIKVEIKNDFIVLLCGGGRKNETLVHNLKKFIHKPFYNIDQFNIDGDFVESQAFAYLSIRSLYKKDISFPDTTNITKPLSGE